ncbi:MAG: DNA repair protein RecO [Candidatus Melainabacteria bacterium]|nr:DNA repair protein RecO [Candidatus Melainabacteria bacterium]
MPTYNDYGIVLSSYNLAESDKILNIYTKDNGLVRAIAKGVKKSKSRFSGKVEQLSCCYFQFARGKNLDIISDCSQVNGFALLKSDLIRLSYGILFIEVVSSFAHEMESESVHVYDLLYSGLEELQKVNNPVLFSIRFLINFLSIHGLSPQLETCVSCSKEVQRLGNTKINEKPDVYPYSSALGGLLCKKCSDFIDHKLVTPEILLMLKQQTYMFVEQGSDLNSRIALDILREHLDLRAKNKIKTFDLVFSL